jgi:alpha-tubulin suppressor-like RCC1 family protein
VIPFFKDKIIVDISVGAGHNLAISKNGEIFGWGENTRGNFGINEKIRACLPLKIFDLNNK